MNRLVFKIFCYRNTYYIFLIKKHRSLLFLGKFSYYVNTPAGSSITGFYLNLKKFQQFLYTKKQFLVLKNFATLCIKLNPSFILLLSSTV